MDEYPYVYLDGIVLKRSWAGEVSNVSVLIAIGVNSQGFRKILGVVKGLKEDKSGWSGFLQQLKTRGLSGGRLFTHDACMGLVESLAEYYPESKWQRCIVHLAANKGCRRVPRWSLGINAVCGETTAYCWNKMGTEEISDMDLLRKQGFEQMMEADAG